MTNYGQLRLEMGRPASFLQEFWISFVQTILERVKEAPGILGVYALCGHILAIAKPHSLALWKLFNGTCAQFSF